MIVFSNLTTTRSGLKVWPVISGGIVVSLLKTSLVLAQLTPAITPTTGPGGFGTTVTQAGNTYQITGGTRPSNGPNLFHSFGEFGVPTNHLANFLNETALPTSNILGRVTGGNPSNIFGTLQTTGFGSANLFLMNPAGIVFGPNASLNVGGSASFTTADYLRLADGAKFNAIPGPQDAVISSAPVAAFGFLGTNPAAITVQGGQLSVSEGHGISLVGGNIDITAGTLQNGTTQPALISAPSGQINLVSVASPGEVLLNSPVGQSVEPAVNGFTTFGNISLSRGASLDTSADTAGRIVIRAVNSPWMMHQSRQYPRVESGVLEGPPLPPPYRLRQSLSPSQTAPISQQIATVQRRQETLPSMSPRSRRKVTRPTSPAESRQSRPIAAQNLITSDNRSPAAEAGPAGRITMQGVGGPGTPAASITLKDTAVSTQSIRRDGQHDSQRDYDHCRLIGLDQ